MRTSASKNMRSLGTLCLSVLLPEESLALLIKPLKKVFGCYSGLLLFPFDGLDELRHERP
mgnify:CR=1 FL=1